MPSEYDFDLLDAIIQHKFETEPGRLEVKAGKYEYFKTKNSSDVLSRSSLLLPGTAITMAIILIRPILTNETCPMLGCNSIQTTEALGGGRTWYVVPTSFKGFWLIMSSCKFDTWFSSTNKRRRPLHHLLSAIFTLSDSSAVEDQIIKTERANKRARLSSMGEDVGVYRNVRFSHDELPDSYKLSNDVPDNLETSGLQYHDFKPSSSSPTQSILGKKEPFSPLTIPGEEGGSESSQSMTEPPVDFDDAVSYVQKVKHRFLDQPDTYRQFLEILKTYQRESTPVQEIHSQVVDVFASASNLVEGFNEFMPNSARYAKATGVQTTHGNPKYGAGRKRRSDSLDSGQGQS